MIRACRRITQGKEHPAESGGGGKGGQKRTEPGRPIKGGKRGRYKLLYKDGKGYRLHPAGGTITPIFLYSEIRDQKGPK